MAIEGVPLQGGIDNINYKFNIQLGDNFLQFTVNYVEFAGPSWSVDIKRKGVTLIDGAMLEPNAIITDDYNADIGSLVFIGEDVTLDNLGVDNKLIWISNDE